MSAERKTVRKMSRHGWALTSSTLIWEAYRENVRLSELCKPAVESRRLYEHRRRSTLRQGSLEVFCIEGVVARAIRKVADVSIPQVNDTRRVSGEVDHLPEVYDWRHAVRVGVPCLFKERWYLLCRFVHEDDVQRGESRGLLSHPRQRLDGVSAVVTARGEEAEDLSVAINLEIPRDVLRECAER